MECSGYNLHYSMSSGFVDADGVSLLSGGGTLVLETHDAVRYQLMERYEAYLFLTDLRSRRTRCHD